MALKKEKKHKNGITTKYHRVVSVASIVNHSTIIEVCGYPSEGMREVEKAALEAGEQFDVYMDTAFYGLEYSEKFDVKAAYKWLKEHPDFADAEDV